MANATINMNIVIKNKQHLDDLAKAIESLAIAKELHPGITEISEALVLLESVVSGLDVTADATNQNSVSVEGASPSQGP